MTATCSSSYHSAHLGNDDVELMRAARSGDRAAQRRLCERVYPVAWSVIGARTRGSSLSPEDIVQATLERVYKSLVHGAFAGACSLTTWVKGIARIAVIDAYRAAYREQEGLNSYCRLRQDTIDGESFVVTRDELRSASFRMARMKPVYSNVLVAAGALGMSIQETASLTHASVVATQSRLRRARGMLRRGRRLDAERGSHAAVAPHEPANYTATRVDARVSRARAAAMSARAAE